MKMYLLVGLVLYQRPESSRFSCVNETICSFFGSVKFEMSNFYYHNPDIPLHSYGVVMDTFKLMPMAYFVDFFLLSFQVADIGNWPQMEPQ
jgi:hypothetical protein